VWGSVLISQPESFQAGRTQEKSFLFGVNEIDFGQAKDLFGEGVKMPAEHDISLALCQKG
jgi:hypothetical protein